LIGVELVECLAHHRKKVTFLVREPWYWPAAFFAEEGALITEHLRRRGVDVRFDEQVGQVLTDETGRVRAVRGESGREYECQMLGVAIGVHPNIEWLRGTATPPAMEAGILTSSSFATSLPAVWAAGDCAEIQRPGGPRFVEQLWYTAKRQGELAALAMLGDEVDYRPPTFYNSAMFFDIEYTTVGSVANLPPGADNFYFRFPGAEASLRIVEHGGAVIGFNMLGSRWDHTFFERWIAERRTLDYVMDNLARAQFDVEFGRRELAGAQAAYRAAGMVQRG
jgi:NADPH-dependent 2,4-dienoyl-CoA reductase/sulfur reductase-like enzyme